MSNDVNLHRCIFLLTSFQIISAQLGFHKLFLGNMAPLIRSYDDIVQFLARSCQDLTKISMEGRPGFLLLELIDEQNKGYEEKVTLLSSNHNHQRWKVMNVSLHCLTNLMNSLAHWAFDLARCFLSFF